MKRRRVAIVNARISIPPGAENYREEATLRLPMDATIMEATRLGPWRLAGGQWYYQETLK